MSAVLSETAAIRARNVGVRFFTERRDVTAIKSLDLDVAQGEFLTLLGPSGCGKSTFLRVVADLQAASRGEVSIFGGTPQAARGRRDIGFVFQDAALLPWRTALANVELPLQVGGGAGRRGRRSPMELLEMVGLKDRAHAYPHELSGGQRQRVLMLAANPGRVREVVPVELPEDRSLATRETPEFVALTARLRRLLETC